MWVKNCTPVLNVKRNFLNPLKVHLHIQSGIKPYKCVKCNKSFHDLNGFKRHTRTHSSKRPYKCSKCSSPFRQPHYLKVHLKTKHDTFYKN
jgi:KRAB domain-containing zinc finger protein